MTRHLSTLMSRLTSLRQIRIQPLYVMCVWPILAFGLYALKWSDLYPEARWDGVIFLVVVVTVFGLFGRLTSAGVSAPQPRRTSAVPVVMIVGYFLIASLVNGGIPAILIMRGQPYDIYSFGLPNLHIAMLAFSGYYGTRLFADFVKTKSRRSLVLYFLIVGWLLLIASRGAVSFLAFSSLVVLLMAMRISVVRVAGLAVGLALFLLGFGLFGNRRLAFQISQANGRPAAPDAILDFAGASDSFIQLGIPASLMWSYLYLSSPIANLMAAFDYTRGSLCGPRCDFPGLIAYGLLPDVLGVRLANLLGLTKFDKGAFLMRQDLTASTIFGSAIGYAGLIGAVLVMLALLALSLLTLRRFDGSDIREVGLALLCTILFFSFFENMIAYSPLSLQLAIALLVARPIPGGLPKALDELIARRLPRGGVSGLGRRRL